MNTQFINEVKARKEELLRELKALETFLAFYEQRNGDAIPAHMTLEQANARKLFSVRLGNMLFEHFGKEKALGDVLNDTGSPVTPEFESKFRIYPNVGRKALNELNLLLERVE